MWKEFLNCNKISIQCCRNANPNKKLHPLFIGLIPARSHRQGEKLSNSSKKPLLQSTMDRSKSSKSKFNPSSMSQWYAHEMFLKSIVNSKITKIYPPRYSYIIYIPIKKYPSSITRLDLYPNNISLHPFITEFHLPFFHGFSKAMA